MRRLLILLSVLWTAPVIQGHVTPAQVATSPEAPPSATAVQHHTPVVPAGSMSLVEIYFVARLASDRDAAPMNNLRPADCTAAVDGKPQPVPTVSSSNVPLTLGLLLDASLDQERVLPMEQQAAAGFLRGALHPGDEAFLLSFDVTVDLLADLTANQVKLKRALERTQINSSSGNYANGTIPSIGRPKGALLYDAVYLAAHEELRHQPGRKVLVLLTGGRDDGSRNKLRSAMEAAQQTNATVYVVFVSDPGIYGILDESGSGPMRKLAQSTGGRFFHVGKDGRKLHAAFLAIQNELQSQYRISLVATGADYAPGHHSLRIACSQNGKPLHVQAPQGFYGASR